MELVPGARVKDCGKWDEGVCGSITKNTCEHTHTQTHTHTYTHTHVHVHVPSGCCSVLVSDYEGGFTRTICVEAITKLWLIPHGTLKLQNYILGLFHHFLCTLSSKNVKKYIYIRIETKQSPWPKVITRRNQEVKGDAQKVHQCGFMFYLMCLLWLLLCKVSKSGPVIV